MTREEEKLKAADEYIKNRIKEGQGRTGDVFPAFIEGIEWADANPDGEMLLHVLNKSAEQAKKQMIDRVCEWLIENIRYYSTNALGAEYLAADLKQAMEGK